MRHEKFFRLWFVFVGCIVLLWFTFLIWAIVQGINILRLWVSA